MRQKTIVLAGIIMLAVGAQQALAQKKPGPEDVTALGKTMTPRALDAQRGGQALVINKNDLDARMHDTRAIDNVTGSNYIAGESFSRSSGLPVAIQNTGNNVIIQNSFILNMELK
ncbi:MAG TPA: hypothetical protein VMH26_05925 [Burkholderiales bacterium]|nr:hypothetical protein [Burkholderiales bacterium]